MGLEYHRQSGGGITHAPDQNQSVPMQQVRAHHDYAPRRKPATLWEMQIAVLG
jgi:hypothetical protein